VTGECETKYTLIHDRTRMSQRASTMHVTTVRNYNNCLQRPFYIQGIFQGVYVHDAEQVQLGDCSLYIGTCTINDFKISSIAH